MFTGVVHFYPPVLAFNFLSRIGFSNPTPRRFFIECLLLTHALALSASQSVHKQKAPTKLYEYSSRPRFKNTLLKSTPRFKDKKKEQNHGAPQIDVKNYGGGTFFHHTSPPKNALAHQPVDCTENGLLLLVLHCVRSWKDSSHLLVVRLLRA